VNKLENYLAVLIVQKIEAALANEDIDITPDELAHVVSLAMECALSSESSAFKIHRG
jgi:hypothetical protein